MRGKTCSLLIFTFTFWWILASLYEQVIQHICTLILYENTSCCCADCAILLKKSITRFTKKIWYQYCTHRLNSLLLYNNIFDFVKIFKTKMSIEGHLYRNMCHRNTKSLKYVNHDHSLQLKPLGNVGFRVKKLRQERIYSANAVRVAFWISLANAIRVNRLFTPEQEKSYIIKHWIDITAPLMLPPSKSMLYVVCL